MRKSRWCHKLSATSFQSTRLCWHPKPSLGWSDTAHELLLFSTCTRVLDNCCVCMLCREWLFPQLQWPSTHKGEHGQTEAMVQLSGAVHCHCIVLGQHRYRKTTTQKTDLVTGRKKQLKNSNHAHHRARTGENKSWAPVGPSAPRYGWDFTGRR